MLTGAARGQGAAEARALAAEGAVVVATRRAATFERTASARDIVRMRQLDVTDPAGWTELAAWLEAEHGHVDALVNNAGIASRGRLPYVDLDTWRRTFEINVTGALLGIQALVPLMPAGSSIVNVCSVAALSGHVAAAYTASKWALRGLSRTASLELGGRGIRVNAVMPGLIETPLMESASPAFRGAALAEIPLGRTGTVDDVAPLDRLSGVRRVGVRQRCRDRRRRRSDRARLAQGRRRRHQPGGAGMKLATAERERGARGSVPSSRTTCSSRCPTG